jgi:hypothetical protein
MSLASAAEESGAATEDPDDPDDEPEPPAEVPLFTADGSDSDGAPGVTTLPRAALLDGPADVPVVPRGL